MVYSFNDTVCDLDDNDFNACTYAATHVIMVVYQFSLSSILHNLCEIKPLMCDIISSS